MLSVEKAEKIRNDNVKLMHFITGIIMIIIGLKLEMQGQEEHTKEK